MSSIPRTSPADVMTIGNGVCGFLALAVLGDLWISDRAGGAGLDHDTLVLCLFLYGVGMLLDVLDGPVARRFGSSGLGATLDTICDTISFGLLPAMLFVATIHEEPRWRAPALLAAGIYVGMTMLRLARNARLEADEAAVDAHAEGGAFSGMPSPVGGNCVLAIVVLAPSPAVGVAVVTLVGFLLVSDFPYPNNRRFGGVYVAALLAASFIALAGLIPLEVPAAAALVGLLPLAVVRAVTGWSHTVRHLESHAHR